MPRLDILSPGAAGAATQVSSRVLVCVFASSIDEPSEGRIDGLHASLRSILAVVRL
jgi:hypothetical protein